MKKFFLAIVAIAVVVLWFAPLVQAVTINGERQVGVSSQPTDYQQPVADVLYKSEVTAKEFRALKTELRNYKKNQKARVDGIDNRLNVNEKNVGILFSAHKGLVEKFNQLLGFSTGNINSINGKISELSCGLDTVKSFQDLLWFILKILILAGAVIGVVTLLRRRA